jgi:hypothetical protein
MTLNLIQVKKQFFATREVRFGSKADVGWPPVDVRFTPESGHRLALAECPLCANNGHFIWR